MPLQDSNIFPYVYEFPSRVATNESGSITAEWPVDSSPFASTRRIGENNALGTIQVIPNGFSPEECKRIIAMGAAEPRMEGRVEIAASAYRASHISWIQPTPDSHWLFHRLGVLFTQAKNHYGIDLEGFVDPIQFTEYGPEQYFDWHMDLGHSATSTRKLSLSLQLSGSEDYQGGSLEFINAPDLPQARNLGDVVLFPSYLAHRVTRIEKGIRRSMVAWACGPAFR